ncbi:unnamed protein product [Heligmosomoides polygyrus]|uniref:Glyco_trans_2-like domain-containing protein n=1 Tax=Heligmosomoides polygyrus TaxID=6339 RepID=A0A183GB74_HELPZ|nr:unnamed protein product [Heligmosomoides polygyrus]
MGLSEESSDLQEKTYHSWGIKSFAFDVLSSDRLGMRRELGRQCHELCKNTTFDAKFSTSVVIIHHNEALSVLLRMLTGIFERTPAHLLHEVILYEDASEEEHKLSKYLNEFAAANGWTSKMRVERSDERQGLIRAKNLASRLATGDVLVFLDSHCEVTDGWLEPLLAPIAENSSSVVLPIADLLHPVSFNYSQAMITKSGFDWSLTFKWMYIDWEYFDTKENNVKPIESPSMSGGLLAVRRDYFQTLGEFDMGMEIWGAENVDLALKTWMCGGRIVVAPCSRVGHVFRMHRPYKGKEGMDTTLYNSVRVAKTWLGKYEELFMRARPMARMIDYGDISSKLELKKRLNCKDMDWYMENVYPDLKKTAKLELHEEL